MWYIIYLTVIHHNIYIYCFLLSCLRLPKSLFRFKELDNHTSVLSGIISNSVHPACELLLVSKLEKLI